MWVYIVTCEDPDGWNIEKIFLSEEKALAYCKEMQKKYSYFRFDVSEYWAE